MSRKNSDTLFLPEKKKRFTACIANERNKSDIQIPYISASSSPQNFLEKMNYQLYNMTFFMLTFSYFLDKIRYMRRLIKWMSVHGLEEIKH